MSFVFAPKAFGATASETFTVTIPTVTNIALVGSANNFGTISSAKFGTADTTSYTVLLGDGSATATSYIQSNDPTAPAKQYTISAAPGTGATATTIVTGTGKATLTLANGTTASVNIILQNHSQNAFPKLGDSSGTPVAFSVSGGQLNIAASSSVPFNAATKNAPLDMIMALDMSTVTMASAAGAMSFTLTFTAVGL